MPSNAKHIRKALQFLSASTDDYRDHWICDESLQRILNLHFATLNLTFKFDRAALNRALSGVSLAASSDASTRTSDASTRTSCNFATTCPYNEERRKVIFYLCCSIGERGPATPTQASDCQCVHAQIYQDTGAIR